MTCGEPYAHPMHRLIALSLSLLLASAAYAGAWVQPKGKGLAVAQMSYFTSEHYYDANGDRKKQPRFEKTEFQPYVEYGVWQGLTVGATGYLQAVGQSGDGNFGLADPEFFARAQLWKSDREVVSLQPLIKLSSTFFKNSTPRGGSKSTDSELSLLYGRSLNLLTDHDWLDTRIGYRWRDHDLSPQWKMDAAVGINLTEHIQLVPGLHATIATEMDTATFTNSGDLDYSLFKADLTGIYRLDEGRALHATIFTHLTGEQTGDGTGLMFGLSRSF